jgi:hypothetical protein
VPAHTFPYDDKAYSPAMPVVEVALLTLAQREPAAQLIAVVDSGADATLLPIDALDAAGASYVGTRRMRGITGHALTVDVYVTLLQVGPHLVTGVRAVAQSPGSEAILGRDVLNQLEVTLNGPAQETWIA